MRPLSFLRNEPEEAPSTGTYGRRDSLLNEKKQWAIGMMYADKERVPSSPPPSTANAKSPLSPAQPPAPSLSPSVSGNSLADKLKARTAGLSATPEVSEQPEAAVPVATPKPLGAGLKPAGAAAKPGQVNNAELASAVSKGLGGLKGAAPIPAPLPAVAAGVPQLSESDEKWDELKRAMSRPLKLEEMDFTDLLAVDDVDPLEPVPFAGMAMGGGPPPPPGKLHPF